MEIKCYFHDKNHTHTHTQNGTESLYKHTDTYLQAFYLYMY